jgi:hypothetical protein
LKIFSTPENSRLFNYFYYQNQVSKTPTLNPGQHFKRNDYLKSLFHKSNSVKKKQNSLPKENPIKPQLVNLNV